MAKNISVRHISATGRVTSTRSLASSAGCQLQDKLSGGKYFLFRNQIFLTCSHEYLSQRGGVSPIPRAYPGLAEAPPGYPESPQKTGPPPLGYPQSPPEFPQSPTPPGTTRYYYRPVHVYKPKTTLILVEIAITTITIKSIAGFPTTKPLYPSIPGK